MRAAEGPDVRKSAKSAHTHKFHIIPCNPELNGCNSTSYAATPNLCPTPPYTPDLPPVRTAQPPKSISWLSQRHLTRHNPHTQALDTQLLWTVMRKCKTHKHSSTNTNTQCSRNIVHLSHKSVWTRDPKSERMGLHAPTAPMGTISRLPRNTQSDTKSYNTLYIVHKPTENEIHTIIIVLLLVEKYTEGFWAQLSLIRSRIIGHHFARPHFVISLHLVYISLEPNIFHFSVRFQCLFDFQNELSLLITRVLQGDYSNGDAG